MLRDDKEYIEVRERRDYPWLRIDGFCTGTKPNDFSPLFCKACLTCNLPAFIEAFGKLYDYCEEEQTAEDNSYQYILDFAKKNM